ncbi:MAG: thiol-disulfide oxidoreductase DCC family protein [Acidobacteriota bacterium]
MGSDAREVVLYDDGCPLCTFQMRLLTWLDWRGVIDIRPLSAPATRALVPELDESALRAAIHCVTPTGGVHRGARAIRHLALRLPALIPLAGLLWIPGVIGIAERVYRMISRHRATLGRWFGCAGACAYLPARNQDVDLHGSPDR